MYKAPGIGLAAIQVGVPSRVVVMDLSKRENEALPKTLINPEIRIKPVVASPDPDGGHLQLADQGQTHSHDGTVLKRSRESALSYSRK